MPRPLAIRPLALLLTALLAGAATARAAAPIEIAPGVHLLAGHFAPGSQPDGNTLIWSSPEGLVVVDTGRHVEHTRAIVDYARAARRPIVAVVNTHWHLDHLGGNALIRKEFPGVRIWASDALAAARTGFLANYRTYLEEVVAKATASTAANERAELALLDAAPALAPDEVVAASGARRLAGRELRLELETRAVTAGDLWIFDPESRLLAAGDLVTLPVPFLDTACPEGWRAALDHLAAADFSRLVPGHGAPMARPDFERYRNAFGHLLDCAASSRAQASCVDGWLADVGPLVPEAEHAFARQLLDYYFEAALRAEPARQRKLCAP
jgi:glyoxylase-like metal-dependent hydrolase (beta-lactamase superfamily II)